MKKTLLFFITFFLIAGFSFAQQPQINVGAGASAAIMRGDNQRSDGSTGLDAITSDARMNLVARLSYTTNNGLAGIRGQMGEDSGAYFEVSAWWKVSPEIYIALGEGDGPIEFAGYNFTGWSLNKTNMGTYNAGAHDTHFWGYNGYAGSVLREGHGFFGSSGGPKPSLFVSFTPLPWFRIFTANILSVNIAFPFIGQQWGNTITGTERDFKAVYFDKVVLQLLYSVFNAGDFALTYSGNDYWGPPDVNNIGGEMVRDYFGSNNFFFHWRGKIKNHDLEAGVNYIHPAQGKDAAPLNFGIGWSIGNHWGPDLHVVSARLGFGIPLGTKENGKKDDFIIGTDFAYNRRLTSNVKLFIPVGTGMIFRDQPVVGAGGIKGDEAFLLAWHFSPYLFFNMAPFEIYMGFRIYNGTNNGGWPEVGPRPATTDGLSVTHFDGGINALNKDRIRWSVPISLSFWL